MPFDLAGFLQVHGCMPSQPCHFSNEWITCQLILLIRRATDALIPDLGGTVRLLQYDNWQTSLRHALVGYRLNMSLDRVVTSSDYI